MRNSMPSAPSVREVVEFGLSAIPEGQTVEVPLRDLLYVNQVLGELNRFFHQPDHYRSLEAVAQFLGSVGSGGGYEALHTAYYNKLANMLPLAARRMIEESKFDHPEAPSYYDPAA
jgi:hypothetical protein